MKKMLLSAAAFAVVAVSAVAVAPTTSEAVPSFARQTGAACLSCHFQAIPRLTTFGRNFSMSGMRDMGEQALIEDDHLSLPAQFNGSFLMKVLIANQTDLAGAGQNLGLQMPDESAIFIGGRYGEHVGGLTEVSVNGGGAGVAQAKLNYVHDTDFGHVNLGLFTGDVGIGVLASDPSNAVRHTNRAAVKRAMALENTVVMAEAVSGIALSAFANDSIFVQGVIFASAGALTNPTWGSLNQTGTYLRGAYIAEVGGLEAVLGGWWASQKVASANGGAAPLGATNNQYGVDLQLQGDVGDVSVGFYLPYVIKGEQLNAGLTPVSDITGFQAMLTVGFGHAGVKLGYDSMKTKTIIGGASVTAKRPYVGGWYSVAQNVELELAYTSTDSGVPGAAKVNNTTLVVEYVY